MAMMHLYFNIVLERIEFYYKNLWTFGHSFLCQTELKAGQVVPAADQLRPLEGSVVPGWPEDTWDEVHESDATACKFITNLLLRERTVMPQKHEFQYK